jgi:GNAT superfamily N-acetyltransferase
MWWTACLSSNWGEPARGVCYELTMGYVIRPVASLQELAQVFDLAGAQLPQRLTRQDRRLVELARRFPADRTLMLVAQDQGGIVGGALAFRTDPASPACGVTLRLIGLAPAHRGKGLGRRLLAVDPGRRRGGAATWTSSGSGASGGLPHASRDRPAAGRGDRRRRWGALSGLLVRPALPPAAGRDDPGAGHLLHPRVPDRPGHLERLGVDASRRHGRARRDAGADPCARGR